MKKTKISKNAIIFLGFLVCFLGCDSSGIESSIVSSSHAEKTFDGIKQGDTTTKKINRDTVLIEHYLKAIGADVIKDFDLHQDSSVLRKNIDLKRKKFDFSFESNNIFVDRNKNLLSSFHRSGQRLNWITLNDELRYSIFITDAENILYAHLQIFNKEYKLIDSHPIAVQGGDEWDSFHRVGQFGENTKFNYVDNKEFPRGGFLIQETRKINCKINDDGKIKCEQVSSKLDSIKME